MEEVDEEEEVEEERGRVFKERRVVIGRRGDKSLHPALSGREG